MWFKNARIFNLKEDFILGSDELSERLSQDKLKPCGPQDNASSGWVSPFAIDNEELYCLQSGEAILFTQAIEEKVLPAAVVNQKLQEKISDIKSNTGNKPGRKQQTDLKQEILFDLLPQAFTKIKKLHAYVDKKLNLMIVDSATQNAAENLVSQTRQTLGSFKTSAYGESSAMAQTMTQWVNKGQAAAGFEFGSQVVLETLDDARSVIRAKNVDILNDEMQRHIENGYLVTQLGLVFNDRIELILTHDFAVKSIKFTDLVQDQLEMESIESEEQLLDSRFTLMSLELRDLFESLLALFGDQ